MALGLFQILGVLPTGGSPSTYVLTISSQPNVSTGDHVGTRIVGNEGAIYTVIAVGSSTSITVEDNLTEFRSSEFGVPVTGDGGFGTPEPIRGLTQLPFNSPGWDAMYRRNHKIIDLESFGATGATGITGATGLTGVGGSQTLAEVLSQGNTTTDGTSGGDIVVSSGDEIRGVDGAIGLALALRGGASSGAATDGGAVNILGGEPDDGVGGAVNITGAIGVGANMTGGAVRITGGLSTDAAYGGDIILTGGATPDDAGGGGCVFIDGGQGGSLSGGTGGCVEIRGRQGHSLGGWITIDSGDAITSGAGGDVTITCGNAAGMSDGSTLSLQAGRGGSISGIGGPVTVTGGAGSPIIGAGGSVTISGGIPIDGTGGAVAINGANGVGADRDGGDVTITAGAATGTGADGELTFLARGGSITLNEVGDESLSTTSFMATSIIGALNELKSEVGSEVIRIAATMEAMSNDSGSTMRLGEVVYISDINAVDFANATSNNAASNPIAFVYDADILNAVIGYFVTSGTAIIKLVGGLGPTDPVEAGDIIYLSTTPGRCTTDAPTFSGNIIQSIATIKDPLTYDGITDFLVEVIINFGNRDLVP